MFYLVMTVVILGLLGLTVWLDRFEK